MYIHVLPCVSSSFNMSPQVPGMHEISPKNIEIFCVVNFKILKNAFYSSHFRHANHNDSHSHEFELEHN